MVTAGTSNRVRILPGNLESSPAIERWIGRRLGGVLRRFGRRLTGIDVFFQNANGSKAGGADIRCVMEARINGRLPLAVQGRSGDLYAAIDGASQKLAAAVARAVGRKTARRRRPERARTTTSRARAGTTLAERRKVQAPPAALAPLGLAGLDASDLSGPLATPSGRDTRRAHVIVAGYGPVGRTLAAGLRRAGVPVTIIDANAGTARTQSSLGLAVVEGDVTDPDVLRAAGIEHAAALAVTIPDAEAAVRACRLARGLAPGIVIAARAAFASQGLKALEAGANTVTVEEIATAHAMADAVRSFFVRDEPRCSEGAD